MPVKDNVYYVYAYLDPRKPGKYVYGSDLFFEFEPFYIGKGRDKRYLVHYEVAIGKKKGRTDYNNHKFHSIRQIVDCELMPIIIKIYDNITTEEACLHEMLIINSIGRRDLGSGPLTNLTDGGESTINVAQETKNKISVNKKQYYSNPNNIRRGENHPTFGLRRYGKDAPHYGFVNTQETKDKISKANKGKKRTQEQVERQRQMMLNRPKELVEHIASFTKGEKNPRAMMFIIVSPDNVTSEVKMISGLKNFIDSNNTGMAVTTVKEFLRKSNIYNKNGWSVSKVRIKEYYKP